MSEAHPMDYYGRIRELEARVAELERERESWALELERARARWSASEAALYRVLHAPKNVKALKNIAKRYFKGRTPTIVATLEHRTKEVAQLTAALELADFARREAMERMITMARESAHFDLVKHLHRQRAFSAQTFGPGARAKGVCDHIRKELAEIELDPTDLKEWVDVVLLALDGAWRAGWTPEEIAAAIEAKQTKNEGRKWPDWRTADPNKAIEHVKTPASTGIGGLDWSSGRKLGGES